jgi:HEPN domain-containing protein
MSDPELLADIAKWLRYAREDLSLAREMMSRDHVVPRHVCLYSQQAAEKALKAALFYQEIEAPKTHDLERLLALFTSEWCLKVPRESIARLTEWAVEARYPGDWPEASLTDAREALDTAIVIWDTTVAELNRHGYTGPTS